MPYRRKREPTDPPPVEVEGPPGYDDRQRLHVPVTRVTVGAMITLLREYDPESLFKVAGTSCEPEFDDPVLIVVPGAVYVCQAIDAPRVSVVLSERSLT